MTINDDVQPGTAASLSVDVGGLRQAKSVRSLRQLQLENPSPRGKGARDSSGGSDPYNTSGSFDRKRNWERVGKR